MSLYGPEPATSAVVFARTAYTVWVNVLSTTGQPLTDRVVSWTSSNAVAVAVTAAGNCGPSNAKGCNRTSLYAVGDGTATITATVDGKSASITAYAYLDPPTTNLVNVDFTIIDVDGNGFAPMVKVTLPSGSPDIDVVGLSFSMPGITSLSLCRAVRHVASGGSAEMFREVYGDYELLFSGGKPTAPPAITVFVRDANGIVSKVVAVGKIVPGAMPTTYTGGLLMEPWQIC
jgi:hypothetical protein